MICQGLDLSFDAGMQGGNDHEIYASPKTEGHSVITPVDTIAQCKKLFIDPAPVTAWNEGQACKMLTNIPGFISIEPLVTSSAIDDSGMDI